MCVKVPECYSAALIIVFCKLTILAYLTAGWQLHYGTSDLLRKRSRPSQPLYGQVPVCFQWHLAAALPATHARHACAPDLL